ncbi:glutamate racemase [Lewinella sp. W8]|uniref:glutamate racemase n=1 Tax=Lewinella sp. W8 TaxID=2528208 RepID=UPI001068D208|nr:glutamate racemase [Lewinella sp. W8]
MSLFAHPGSIGVFDSGIGGLSVANAVSGLLPRESLLYVADNARAPYGARSREEIVAFSEQITRHLLAAGAKMIVVACNTATSLAIDHLRETFPEVPFVGLEPAVKPAASGRRIGVLATRATLTSPRYLALRERYLADRPVWENPCIGLVPIIEAEAPGSPVLSKKLRQILDPMLAGGIDTLVLGCTHYPMVREDIQAVCGPEVDIIDPAPAAARQVARLLERHDLSNAAPEGAENIGAPHYDFYTTGTAMPLLRSLSALPALQAHRRLLRPFFSLEA